MRWMMTAAGVLIGCIAALAGIGYSTTHAHVVQMRIDLDAAPDTVERLVRNASGWAEWNEAVGDVEPVEDVAGAWRVSGDVGRVRLAEDPQAGEGAKTYLVQRTFYSGRWSFDVEPRDEGSRVTLTEQARIDNLVVRGLAVVWDNAGGLGAYLSGLAAHFGEQATPQSAG